MESKAVLPLPPGMVPSDSREDMTDLGEDRVEKEKENTVLKEVGTLSAKNPVTVWGHRVLKLAIRYTKTEVQKQLFRKDQSLASLIDKGGPTPTLNNHVA